MSRRLVFWILIAVVAYLARSAWPYLLVSSACGSLIIVWQDRNRVLSRPAPNRGLQVVYAAIDGSFYGAAVMALSLSLLFGWIQLCLSFGIVPFDIHFAPVR